MKGLLSILTAVAFVTVVFAGPGFAGEEKKAGATSSDSKSSGGAASGATGATSQPSSGDKAPGSASPATSGASAEKPASKDDCKDNGWQRFGLKSEAECMSAVEKK